MFVCNNSRTPLTYRKRLETFVNLLSENETAINQGAAQPTESAPEAPSEEITYHAVEKDGVVTAIWEMQGRKHLRTIDPRSRQGKEILRLYTTEHHDEAGEAAAS